MLPRRPLGTAPRNASSLLGPPGFPASPHLPTGNISWHITYLTTRAPVSPISPSAPFSTNNAHSNDEPLSTPHRSSPPSHSASLISSLPDQRICSASSSLLYCAPQLHTSPMTRLCSFQISLLTYAVPPLLCRPPFLTPRPPPSLLCQLPIAPPPRGGCVLVLRHEPQQHIRGTVDS